MSEVKKLAERCKAAYAANNIPWDTMIARCPAKVLKHLAECWEARAEGRDVPETFIDNGLSIKECKKLLENVRGRLAPGERAGQRRFLQTWREYHGS